jgi:CRP/FNR family transcriptional regulator, cyclic AMP receptor protein
MTHANAELHVPLVVVGQGPAGLTAGLLHLLHLKRQANPKVEMLRRIYLFASCSERELRFLATQADAVQAPAGEVLTVEGRPPDTFYMLLEGVVRVRTAGHPDVQYGPGAAFDVVAMAERSPARATITAEGPVRMVVMSHAQFRAVAALPRLGDALWRVTSPAAVALPLHPRHAAGAGVRSCCVSLRGDRGLSSGKINRVPGQKINQVVEFHAPRTPDAPVMHRAMPNADRSPGHRSERRQHVDRTATVATR